MPYFFVSPSIENDRVVEITKPLNEMKFLVSLLNISDTSTARAQVSLSSSHATLMILNANWLHADSLYSLYRPFNTIGDADKLGCTWQTFAAARYCFYYGVLGLRKVGRPPEVDLPSYLRTLLLIDVNSGDLALAPIERKSDFWIWRVISAALALERFGQPLRNLYGLQLFERLYDMAVCQSKAWGKFRNVSLWYDVEDVLKSIVWPDQGCEDAERVWYALVDVKP